MNAIAKKEYSQALASEDELMQVLSNSLYPGAQPESIKMVISYCKASGLDPMQKPCHIVPIWDSKAGSMRDVIMPGIGLYRTQAARSGQYAGVTEPEYGDDITETLGGVSCTYPKWCKVTVKRLLDNGTVVEFTAKEFWKENYSVKGGKEKNIAPNAMWFKRPYGQINKCAEAQALRKAFPEFGSQPTADEMEGKFEEGEKAFNPMPTKAEQKALEYCTDENFGEKSGAWFKLVESGKKTADEIIAMVQTKYLFTDEQIEIIKSWGTIDAT
jgi:phage recombination protein Bet